jgi:hypothetical protein
MCWNGELSPMVFTYLIPACVVSYWIGRRDGLRENRAAERDKDGTSFLSPPGGGGEV